VCQCFDATNDPVMPTKHSFQGAGTHYRVHSFSAWAGAPAPLRGASLIRQHVHFSAFCAFSVAVESLIREGTSSPVQLHVAYCVMVIVDESRITYIIEISTAVYA